MALALEPKHIESLNRLGEALRLQGFVAKAGRAWNDLIDVYQEMTFEEAEVLPADDFVEMGLALVGLNRFQEANSVMFEQAQEKDELNAAYLLAQGRALLTKYNYPDSRDCMREILDVNPRSADALAILADNYLVDFQVGTKRYDLAEKYVELSLIHI